MVFSTLYHIYCLLLTVKNLRCFTSLPSFPKSFMVTNLHKLPQYSHAKFTKNFHVCEAIHYELLIKLFILYVGKFWSGKKMANLANRMPFTNFLPANYFFYNQLQLYIQLIHQYIKIGDTFQSPVNDIISVQQQAALYKGGSTFSRLFCSTDGNSPPGNTLGYHRVGIPSSKISYIANCSMWKSIAMQNRAAVICSKRLRLARWPNPIIQGYYR